MQAEVRTGPVQSADGTIQPARGDKTGGIVVTDGHGHWSEAATRQKLFTAFLAAGTTTVAAGNINAAAAAASTQFAVWNPLGSTVLLVLQRLIITQQSGTPTAGGLYHSSFNAASVAAGVATAGAVRNNYVNAPAGQGLCLASAAGAALTGGLALTTIGPSTLSSSATALASPAGVIMVDTIDGSIVIPPGFGYVPSWTGAGTTYVVGYGLTWEEVSI